MEDNFKGFSDDIKFLRIVWCDNANIIRAKAIHVNNNESEYVIGISCAQQAIPVTYDGLVPDSSLDPVGEVYLKADKSTITPLPYSKGHARAMGNMCFNGSPWEYSTRGFLENMIDYAGKTGLEIMASFENEFYLLNSETKCPEVLDCTSFASTQSMDLNHEFVMDLVDSFDAQDIEVEQYYPESGNGQHELTIKYADALKAADNQIIFRETVHAVASKHGLISSFLPKIFPDQSGSGCHIHMSLWRAGDNVTSQDDGKWGLSDEAVHFIAGVLDNLPALMAITTPTSNSYRRIQPHSWTGKYRCWGLGNREACIRVVRESDGVVKHFEIKTSDATANPYLALGAIIRAGLDGVERKLKLPDPVQVDPGNLNDDERADLGIDDLPPSPDAAIGMLEDNIVLADAMGHGLFTEYVAVKKEEWRFLKDLSMVDEVNMLLRKY
jgi:glutamine synthetase